MVCGEREKERERERDFGGGGRCEAWLTFPLAMLSSSSDILLSLCVGERKAV